MPTPPLATPNEPQRAAIAAQAAVYGTDRTICKGLSHHVPRPASYWGDYPTGAVAVEFCYIPADLDDPLGLEVTVFAADGTVLDSQDFG
jgi:hypothetical protein